MPLASARSSAGKGTKEWSTISPTEAATLQGPRETMAASISPRIRSGNRYHQSPYAVPTSRRAEPVRAARAGPREGGAAAGTGPLLQVACEERPAAAGTASATSVRVIGFQPLEGLNLIRSEWTAIQPCRKCYSILV